MKKRSIKDFRIILTINFVAEILGVISLYLSGIHSVRILSINILSGLSVLFSIVGILLLFKLIKKNQIERMLTLSSIVSLVLVIIFSLFSKTGLIAPYFQVISDILKFLVILSILKSLIKTKIKKSKNIIIVSMILYVIAKICYVILSLSNGITLRPVLTTISIICIVIVYTLYIKFLEKDR